MKFGVVVFPGSNCVDDMVYVLGRVMECEVIKLWHKNPDIGALTTSDCIVLPGGFSYGDYLRPGAIAKFSPIMDAVYRFAREGGILFGICNGFQILCEMGLLPGALLRNRDQRFISKSVYLRTVTTNSRLTHRIPEGAVIRMPIAHADGRYHINAAGLESLLSHDQILFQYCDASGALTPGSNINGSVSHIAGICNRERNVFGMMPHPERASEEILGSHDGKALFASLLSSDRVQQVL